MSWWIILIGWLSLVMAGLVLARAAKHADRYERACWRDEERRP